MAINSVKGAQDPQALFGPGMYAAVQKGRYPKAHICIDIELLKSDRCVSSLWKKHEVAGITTRGPSEEKAKTPSMIMSSTTRYTTRPANTIAQTPTQWSSTHYRLYRNHPLSAASRLRCKSTGINDASSDGALLTELSPMPPANLSQMRCRLRGTSPGINSARLLGGGRESLSFMKLRAAQSPHHHLQHPNQKRLHTANLVKRPQFQQLNINGFNRFKQDRIPDNKLI
ncbi:hypothetical protein Forpe1208_v001797 [Fusarium oxysporum f. sp. rapae]|uniref:Uncharacterized protein n=1 Tax=Fusarium oxysporum f. sp. rapae TaxID=485398 RepID=A0A8J5PLZ4_FUSOX|nr:hypothetical protein Forpe1208_v001797 [Fusarium oxysporum f. sp. rapae]